ncbi:MAG TPA: hypothetical protein VIJ14_02030 [Rhabdochlamydiaceae bacterium]
MSAVEDTKTTQASEPIPIPVPAAKSKAEAAKLRADAAKEKKARNEKLTNAESLDIAREVGAANMKLKKEALAKAASEASL